MAISTSITHISPIYKYYFLYFEAPMALVGTALILVNPTRFLNGTLPYNTLVTHPLPLTPPVKMLLTNIAFLYAMIFVLEGIVLRASREKVVWKGILGAMLVSDVGHLWSLWEVDATRMGMLGAWTGDEWFNYGTLWAGTVLRVAFIYGLGWR